MSYIGPLSVCCLVHRCLLFVVPFAAISSQTSTNGWADRVCSHGVCLLTGVVCHLLVEPCGFEGARGAVGARYAGS